MADALVISDLKVHCRIGVTDEERTTPQVVWIDLRLAIDAKKVAVSDKVEDAVDYAGLVTAVKKHVEGTSFHLLETLAEDVAALVLRDFSVPAVFVRLKKRALPDIDSAAIEVTRETQTPNVESVVRRR